jgi:hypothetical protein
LAVLLGGVGLFTIPVSAVGPDGYAFSCGTVMHRDNEAVERYEIDRVKRAAKAALDEIGPASTGVSGPGSELPGLAGVPDISGAVEKRTVDSSPNALCSRASSPVRSWLIVLILCGVALIVTGTARRLNRLVQGGRFPTWMRRCPDWIAGGLTIAAGVTGACAGIAAGSARLIWMIGTFALAVGAILLAAARETDRRRTREIIEDVTQRLREDHHNLLGNQLTSLIQLVAEAGAVADRTTRLQQTAAARISLVHAAANLVGRATAANTVRANLFEMSPDRRKMTPVPQGCAGRPLRTNRTFRANTNDRTFDLTIAEQHRFVRDCTDMRRDDGSPLAYATFITYPVSIGPNRIRGVLTVDSLKTGDLDPEEDLPMMAILTALIAVTYEFEKYADAATTQTW